ncbi:MAG: AAA family ATPase [Acidobacteriota bacterium]
MARTSRALAAFLPAHLIEDLAADPGGGVPLESRFEAALLLSDISGFTALTERLEGRGRQGAEEIAAIVSNAFRPAITSIRRFGGSIVSFGGDAIFSVFRGAGRVRDALAAAQEIRESFGSRAARPGAPAIGISQAVHCGPVRAIHVGVEGARHQVLTGSCVQGLARLQKRARAGEILVSPRARRERARTRRLAPELSLPDVARRYLPRSLIDRLARGSGEYHAASVLFLETRPMAAAALQRFFAALDRSLCDLEGMFLKSDLCADGVRWLCVFRDREGPRGRRGPRRASVDGRGLERWDLGPHPGRAPRGNAREHARRDGMAPRARRDGRRAEHGRARRLAGRLGRGAGHRARGAHAARIPARASRSGAVKGKAGPLALWSLRGTSARAERGPTTPLVGREREMEILRLAIARSAAGDGQIVEIEGEAGLGKSRLKWEAARLARDHGLDVHEGRAISFAGMSYWTIADLVRSTLAVAPDAAAAEAGARMPDAAADLGIGPLETDHLLDVLAARPRRRPSASSTRGPCARGTASRSSPTCAPSRDGAPA